MHLCILFYKSYIIVYFLLLLKLVVDTTVTGEGEVSHYMHLNLCISLYASHSMQLIIFVSFYACVYSIYKFYIIAYFLLLLKLVVDTSVTGGEGGGGEERGSRIELLSQLKIEI